MIHDPLDCQTLVDVVTDWMEGAVPESRRAEIEEHLAICAGCTAYVEQLRSTTRALRNLDEAQRLATGGFSVPPGLLDAFRAQHRPGGD